MDSVLPRKKTLGAVIAAGVVVAAAAAALLLWQGLPNGRAAAADAPPLSQVPQVAIPDSDMAALAQLRDAVQDEPHAIDASLNQRILAGKLDGLIGGALSPSQRAILSDGVITFAEYQKAETAWHVCMANAGFSVPPMHLNGVALSTSPSSPGPAAKASTVRTRAVRRNTRVRPSWSGHRSLPRWGARWDRSRHSRSPLALPTTPPTQPTTA